MKKWIYKLASHKGLFPSSWSGPSQYELSCCGYSAGSMVCPYFQAVSSRSNNTKNKGAGNNEQIKKKGNAPPTSCLRMSWDNVLCFFTSVHTLVLFPATYLCSCQSLLVSDWQLKWYLWPVNESVDRTYNSLKNFIKPIRDLKTPHQGSKYNHED